MKDALDGTVRHKQRAKIEAIGEVELFSTYLELGGVVKMLAKHNLSTANQAFYDFLHEEYAEDTGRWQRWLKTRKIRGDMEADAIVNLAQDVTPANQSAKRTEFQIRAWVAENFNRQLYGKQQQVNVAIGTPEEWLKALNDKEIVVPSRVLKKGEDE